MPEYAQSWKITYPDKPCDVVYTQEIALTKFSSGKTGTAVETLTIVRHDNGGREYLSGTIAADVQRYREGK